MRSSGGPFSHSVVVLLLCSLSSRVGADDVSSSALLTCASLRSDSERLVCYDQLAAQISSGKAEASTPSAASAEAMFGISAQVARVQKPPESAERKELESISSRITKLLLSPRGELWLQLENGQVWQQLSGGDLLLKAGDQVSISRASLGSFWMTTSTSRGGRVKRVQ